MNPKVYTEDELVKWYREFASIPEPKSATILPYSSDGWLRLYTSWSIRDLDRFEKITFSQTFLGKTSPLGDVEFISQGFPLESTKELLHAISFCGQFRAVVKCYTNKKKTDKEIIEIWNKDTKQRTIDLESQDAHGKVYTDGQFGSLQWSRSSKQLIYIAEKKRPLSQSFFKKNKKEDITPGEENVHREDWGEQLVGKHQPVICLLDVASETVQVIDSLPDGVSPGQAIWAPNDEGIIFVGWQEEPRRLGIVYCTNRRSSIYYANLETGESTKLSHQDNVAMWCPRLSPDQSTLIYLENESGGPHRNCSSLIKCDWLTREITTIVEPVDEPDDGFPGIFAERLPHHCWTSDSRKIIFHTAWKSKQELVCVDAVEGIVVRLTNDSTIGDWTLHDLENDLLIASRSAFDLKPHLVAGKIEVTELGLNVSWNVIFPTNYALDGLDWSVLPLQPTDSESAHMQYEALLASPNPPKSQKCPLIVCPHGGPHSAFTPSFSLFVILWVRCGFNVLLVNYRGSTGFGKSQLYSLLGRVGTQDVKDVVFATETAMKLETVDSDRVAIFGGSHGGFLATHLIGQYPDLFKVAVCRNPVVDIAGKLEGTDIPDWGFVESGGGDQFSFDVLPTPEFRNRMWSCSPYQYIANVKAPTLMLIGKVDRRVPPSQGLSYYRTLKARGVTTRLYEYEDNHALSEVDVESECFMHTMLWLQKYLL